MHSTWESEPSALLLEILLTVLLFCFFSLFKLRFVDSMDAELQHFNGGIGAVQTWSSLNQNYEDVLNMDSIEV